MRGRTFNNLIAVLLIPCLIFSSVPADAFSVSLQPVQSAGYSFESEALTLAVAIGVLHAFHPETAAAIRHWIPVITLASLIPGKSLKIDLSSHGASPKTAIEIYWKTNGKKLARTLPALFSAAIFRRGKKIGSFLGDQTPESIHLKQFELRSHRHEGIAPAIYAWIITKTNRHQLVYPDQSVREAIHQDIAGKSVRLAKKIVLGLLFLLPFVKPAWLHWTVHVPGSLAAFAFVWGRPNNHQKKQVPHVSDESVAYQRLARDIIGKINYALPHGGVTVLDGVGGVGKTTEISFIEQEAFAEHRRVAVLDLDAFLYDASVRKEMEESVAQELKPVTNHGASAYRVTEMEDFLTPLLTFLGSEGDPVEERVFQVREPYERAQHRSSVSVRRGDVVLLSGAFAQDLKAVQNSACPKINLRMVSDERRTRDQFENRSRQTYPEDEAHIRARMTHYDLAVLPSWNQYATETEGKIDFFIELFDQPDQWRARGTAFPIFLHLGGTNIRGGSVDPDGSLFFMGDVLSSEEKKESEILLTKLSNQADKIHEFVKPQMNGAKAVLYVSVPGVVREDGFVETSNALALSGVPLREELERRLRRHWNQSVSVHVFNDLEGEAPAEVRANEDPSSFIYLNLGTGLNAARYVKGRWKSLEFGSSYVHGEPLEPQYKKLRDDRKWEDLAKLLGDPLQDLASEYGTREIRIGGGVASNVPEILEGLRHQLNGHVKLVMSNVPEDERGVRGLFQTYQDEQAPPAIKNHDDAPLGMIPWLARWVLQNADENHWTDRDVVEIVTRYEARFFGLGVVTGLSLLLIFAFPSAGHAMANYASSFGVFAFLKQIPGAPVMVTVMASSALSFLLFTLAHINYKGQLFYWNYRGRRHLRLLGWSVKAFGQLLWLGLKLRAIYTGTLLLPLFAMPYFFGFSSRPIFPILFLSIWMLVVPSWLEEYLFVRRNLNTDGPLAMPSYVRALIRLRRMRRRTHSTLAQDQNIEALQQDRKKLVELGKKDLQLLIRLLAKPQADETLVKRARQDYRRVIELLRDVQAQLPPEPHHPKEHLRAAA